MNTVVRIPRRALVAALLAISLAPATAARAADVGAAGPAYTGATAPTGEKPQSKLWFNDGTWWGVLYNSTALRYEIFRDVSGDWRPTGAVIDTRRNMLVDAQWDGAHLNIVSAGTAATAVVRYSRFSYDPGTKTYARDVPPVDLTSYGVEAAVLDRDGAGRLWATWTHDADPINALTVPDTQVEVAHAGIGDDASWGPPAVLPGSPIVTGDDISSVVRYAGHIGVMYSNQDPASGWTFTFASHADGAPDTDWQLSTALQGDQLSDDHINLKALEGDPAGQVFAAVKTSLNAASAPLIKLLVLDNGGAWHDYNVFTVGDQPTRPQVMLDPLRRELHVFASLGPCCTGGKVVVKTADLDNIAFASGTGTMMLDSAANPKLNNVTTTKQPISSAMSFLPVLAGDDSTDRYWTNALALPAGSVPPPSPPAPKTQPASSTPTSSATPLAGESSAPAPAASAAAPIAGVTNRLRLLPAAFRRQTTVAFWLTRHGPVRVIVQRPRGARWVRVQRVTKVGRRGPNAFTLTARGLRPGRYRLVVAVPGGRLLRATFRITR